MCVCCVSSCFSGVFSGVSRWPHRQALVEAGGPNVLDDALSVLKEHCKIDDRAEVAGKYGAHSPLSRVAADQYDRSGEIKDSHGQPAKPIWICGHFVGKAFVGLLEEAEADPTLKVLLWQTKSAVQPHGSEDALPKLKGITAKLKPISKWVEEVRADNHHWAPSKV
jgi:hypothetical protein